jgi:hypothetical protein
LPYVSKEQHARYMRDYRKKQKGNPKRALDLADLDPWKELEVLLGHSVEVHKSHHGYVHAHLSKEDIAKIEANTPYGKSARIQSSRRIAS